MELEVGRNSSLYMNTNINVNTDADTGTNTGADTS